MKKVFEISDMMCNHCVESVTKACKSVEGVENVEVSLNDKTAVVEGNFDEQKILQAIEDIGFEPKLK